MLRTHTEPQSPVLGSARLASIVERGEDARGKFGRAVPVDELEHGLQVDAAVYGEPGGQAVSEPGREQSLAAPLGDRSDRRGWVGCASARIHA
jgi:hypothetical protein